MSWSQTTALVSATASFAVVARVATKFPRLRRYPTPTLLWILACICASTILQLCSQHDENHPFPTFELFFLTACALWYGLLAHDLATATADPCFKFKPAARGWSHVVLWPIALVYSLSADALCGATHRLARILPSIAVLGFVAFQGFTTWRRIREPDFQAHITTDRVIKITTRLLAVFTLSSVVTSALCFAPASPVVSPVDRLTIAVEALSLCVLFCCDVNFWQLCTWKDLSSVLATHRYLDEDEAEQAALPLGPVRWLGDLRSLTFLALDCAYQQPDNGDGPSSELLMARHGAHTSTIISIICYAPRVFEIEQQRLDVSRSMLHTMFYESHRCATGHRREIRAMSFPVMWDGRYSIQYLPAPQAVATLVALLPAYTSYVATAPRTLLNRYVGLFSLSVPLCTRRLGVVVIANGFRRPTYEVRHVVTGAVHESSRDTTQETISIDASAANFLLRQLQEDCGFLAEQGIVGYRVVFACSTWSSRDEDDGGIPSTNTHRPGKYQFRIVDFHRKFQPNAWNRLMCCGQTVNATPIEYARRLLERVQVLLGGLSPMRPEDGKPVPMSEVVERGLSEPPSRASSEATISIPGSSFPSVGREQHSFQSGCGFLA